MENNKIYQEDEEFTVRPIEDEDESTFRPFATLEVLKDNRLQKTFPILKSPVTIGRKSKKNCPDIPLEAGREMSRFHAELDFDGDNFWLKANEPTMLQEKPVKIGERIKVFSEQSMQIGEFILRLKDVAVKSVPIDDFATRKDDFATRKKSPDEENFKILYWLEVLKGAEFKETHKIYDSTISVGREGNIKLTGNPNISRKQIELIYEKGIIFLIAVGKNSITLNSAKVANNEKIALSTGQIIGIEDYALMVKTLNDVVTR